MGQVADGGVPTPTSSNAPIDPTSVEQERSESSEDAEYLDLSEEWSTGKPPSSTPSLRRQPRSPSADVAGTAAIPQDDGGARSDDTDEANPRASQKTSRRQRPVDVIPKEGILHAKKVRGIARSVERRQVNEVELLTFRVDRYDASGNRLTPVAVQTRYARGGFVTDGDEVEVAGRAKHGTLRAKSIVNVTTESRIKGGIPGWLKWVGIAIVVVAAIVLLAVVLAKASGGPSEAGFLSNPVGKVRVPNVVGEELSSAISAQRAAGLSAQSVSEPSDSVPFGRVIRTDPPAGTMVESDSAVIVVVSTGPSGPSGSGGSTVTVSVPNVVGLDEASALAALKQAGLSPKRTTKPSDSVPEGDVIRTNPPADSMVERNSSVTVVVSSGPSAAAQATPTSTAMVVIPEVAGMDEASATQALSDLGLTVVKTTEGFCTGTNSAIRTDPPAGSSVPVGSTVTLVHSC